MNNNNNFFHDFMSLFWLLSKTKKVSKEKYELSAIMKTIDFIMQSKFPAILVVYTFM